MLVTSISAARRRRLAGGDAWERPLAMAVCDIHAEGFD